MKIIKNKRKNIFANISVSEIFILKYMKDMPQEAVKLYMYLLYIEANQINIEIETISKEINISLKDVKASLDYLQEKGLIIMMEEGFYIVDLQEKEVMELYTPKVTASKEMIEANQKKNNKREKIINDIESMYFAGNMKAEWYKKIILWFEKYNFSNEAMLGIFSHCFSDEVKPIAYVETVVKSMADKGVITINDLSKQIVNYDKKSKIIKFVKTELNLHKALTKPQERIVEKWIFDYNYDKEQIKLVIDKTINAQNVGFNYLDKIITEWYQQGLKTVEDILKYEKENKEKLEEKKKEKNNRKTTNNITSNNIENREQRKYEDFQVFDLF
ncbi:MAG: DnaD domain protein [Clostridiales bacterium]|jgi:DNA replication protein dnaD|nr:DnaD domain protein [Clostridiales bacterium]